MLSWNVNGLRAVAKKGFTTWLESENPDILALQEVRAELDQLPASVKDVEGYHTFYCSGDIKGYSGVAVFSKSEPRAVRRGIDHPLFDNEGRFLIVEYEGFTLYNVYFPNGSASRERLEYKLAFYDAFLDHLRIEIAGGCRMILCGDFNTAHRAIDLARPDENENRSGFLPEERERIDRLVELGFVDTFRIFESDGGRYTYWDFKTRARSRNVGWRIDYFFVSESMRTSVVDAFILSDVMGSDHCPTGIEVKQPV